VGAQSGVEIDQYGGVGRVQIEDAADAFEAARQARHGEVGVERDLVAEREQERAVAGRRMDGHWSTSAEEAEAPAAEADGTGERTLSRMRSTTQAQRQAAAKRERQASRRLDQAGCFQPARHRPVPLALGTPCGPADYFGTVPNYALSKLPLLTVTSGTCRKLPVTYSVTGGIRKFVDTYPGLGPANKNNLGNFIPSPRRRPIPGIPRPQRLL
jgi:hypothetical protein